MSVFSGVMSLFRQGNMNSTIVFRRKLLLLIGGLFILVMSYFTMIYEVYEISLLFIYRSFNMFMRV